MLDNRTLIILSIIIGFFSTFLCILLAIREKKRKASLMLALANLTYTAANFLLVKQGLLSPLASVILANLLFLAFAFFCVYTFSLVFAFPFHWKLHLITFIVVFWCMLLFTLRIPMVNIQILVVNTSLSVLFIDFFISTFSGERRIELGSQLLLLIPLFLFILFTLFRAVTGFFLPADMIVWENEIFTSIHFFAVLLISLSYTLAYILIKTFSLMQNASLQESAGEPAGGEPVNAEERETTETETPEKPIPSSGNGPLAAEPMVPSPVLQDSLATRVHAPLLEILSRLPLLHHRLDEVVIYPERSRVDIRQLVAAIESDASRIMESLQDACRQSVDTSSEKNESYVPEKATSLENGHG